MKRMLTIILLLFAGTYFTVQAQMTMTHTGFAWPDGSNMALNAIYMLDESSAVIACSDGFIAKTMDAGKTFQIASGLEEITDHVNAIYFWDAAKGIVSTRGGDILLSEDGGSSWTVVASGTDVNLMDLAVVESTVYACGTTMVIKSTDAGQTWAAVTAPPVGDGKDLNAIAFVDENIGYTGGKTNDIFRTVDGGATWELVFGASGTVRDIVAFSALEVLVVSDGGLQMTEDGGENWAVIEYPQGEKMWAANFADRNNGVAVGQNGLVIITADGGQTWTQVESGSSSKLRGTFMMSPDVYAVSGQGDEFMQVGMVEPTAELVAHTTGAAWPDGSNMVMNQGWMLDPSTIVLACSEGIIQKTTDGGNSFVEIKDAVTDPTGHLTDLYFWDGSKGIIVGFGGQVWLTSDGGDSFTRSETGIDADLMSVSVVGDIVYASGTGVVIKSTDAGQTWTSVTSPVEGKDLNGIDFVDENIGYTGGKTNDIYRTTDGGMTWELVFAGTATARDIVAFSALEILVVSDGGFDYTEDGGENWATIEYPQGEKMWRAYFYDRDNGIAVGQGGLVILTDDGGMTWTQIETGSSSKLRAAFMYSPSVFLAGGQGDELYTMGAITSVRIERTNAVPQDFSLGQNYPNPFNPETTISFDLKEAGFVKLAVYDITGRLIEELASGQFSAGTYDVHFRAGNLSSGVYLYTLQTERFTATKKMLLMK